MRAGRMDRRLTLQHRVLASPNAEGERVPSFSTYVTVWGTKLDQRAREFFAAQGTNAEQVTQFRIRHRMDVLQTDRIVYKGANFDIVQISEIGRRAGLDLFATTAPP